jgi:hypothetical protein
VVDLKEICESHDRTFRIGIQARSTIQQVLSGVECTIADEWLWIDDQPWLTFSAEYIASVKVSGK